MNRVWMSICSCHRKYQDDCDMCRVGEWRWTLSMWVEHQIYCHVRPLWRWWVNRPNSARRRRLEKTFPRLKS